MGSLRNETSGTMAVTGANDVNYSDWAQFLGNARSHDLILGLHRSLSSGESGQTRGRAAQSQHAPSSDHTSRGTFGVAVGLIRARLCWCRVRPHQLLPNLLPNSLLPEPTQYLLNFNCQQSFSWRMGRRVHAERTQWCAFCQWYGGHWLLAWHHSGPGHAPVCYELAWYKTCYHGASSMNEL